MSWKGQSLNNSQIPPRGGGTSNIPQFINQQPYAFIQQQQVRQNSSKERLSSDDKSPTKSMSIQSIANAARRTAQVSQGQKQRQGQSYQATLSEEMKSAETTNNRRKQ